jgi:hypothetical protein
MPLDYEEYSTEFQLKLLSLLIREPEQVLGIVEARHFTSPIFTDIARIVTHAYKRHPNARLTKSSVMVLVKEELGKKRRNLWPTYKHTIRELYQSQPDDEFVLEQAVGFARQRRYRQALVDAEKDVNVGNYKRAARRFQDAAISDGKPESKIELPVIPLHRLVYSEQAKDDRENHIVYPIIPKGGAVLLYGLPKELKSWLAAGLVIDVACGRKALGYFHVPCPVKTLYVQVEDPPFVTQNRMKELAQSQRSGRACGMLNIIPRCPLNLMDPEWMAALTREIAKFRPELVVLDVFRRLFRGNVADSQETARFLQGLDTLRDEYGCAVLLVHHARKAETAEIQTRALGSVNLTAWADVLLYTGGKKRIGNASVGDLYIESKTVTLDEDKWRVTVDSEAVPMVGVCSELEYDMTWVQLVVREHPGLNQKQLEEPSGFKEKRLRKLLKRAVEKHLLREERGSRKELLYFPVEK